MGRDLQNYKMVKTNYVTEAIHLINAGISVGPIKIDGSKLPAIRWKDYQKRFMTQQEINQHFSNCGGIFAITGTISKLFLLDFDLKYDHADEDTFEKFIAVVPETLKAKFSINKTRSGGMHIWVRTEYTDRSRKITRRDLSLSEFNLKVKGIMEKNNANEKTAVRIALAAPYECTLETRGEGSYGVISHPSYTPVQKSNGQWVTKEEMEWLLSVGYFLDCGFRKREQLFIGEEDIYKEISRFNEDCGASGMVELLKRSGLYESIGTDYNGNYLMKRAGSTSPHSGYVYQDSGIFKIFGTNLFDTNKDIISPFEVYKFLTGTGTDGAIKRILDKRKTN